jgi:hypothetical protein
VTFAPNYLIGVLDPAAPDFFGRTVTATFPANVYEPSKIARDMGVDYLDSIGKNHEFLSPVGTDAFSFTDGQDGRLRRHPHHLRLDPDGGPVRGLRVGAQEHRMGPARVRGRR